MTWIFDRLQLLGRARDGMLVAVALVYIFGFVSWAAYSSGTGIGFIRIFDAQYLIAGLPLAAVLLLIFLAWTRWQNVPPMIRSGAAIFIYIIYSVLIVKTYISIGDVSLFRWINHLTWSAQCLAFVGGSVLTPWLLIGLRQAATSEWPKNSRFSTKVIHELLGLRWIIIIFGYFLATLIGFITIMSYFVFIYPGLPQEFGGPRPRCANVIVEEQVLPRRAWERLGAEVVEIAPETSPIGQLINAVGRRRDAAIMFERARVLYSDDKTVIFRPVSVAADVGAVEIRKDLVRTLAWCKS